MTWLSSFIFGLVFGSFLNVVVYRLKNGGRLIFSRSFCPDCKMPLKWYDLVPVLSFFWLLGRCRHCGKKISWQYPIVEILSGFIWVGAFYQNFNNYQLPIANYQMLNVFYQIFILSIFLAIAVYDARWMIIPDKLVYPAIFISLFYNGFLSLNNGDFKTNFLYPAIAAAVAFAFFYGIHKFSRGRAMGLGDAKLAISLSLFLGPVLSLAAFFLAFITGAVYGIMLLAAGKKSLKSRIAFGPFLALGALLSFFFAGYLFGYFI